MKPHLEEFELKINVDENTQLQLRKDNTYLQPKKNPNSRNRKSRASNVHDHQAGDEEMVEAEGRMSSRPSMSLKKTRAQFEAQQMSSPQ